MSFYKRQIGHEHYTYDANGNPTRVENDSTAAVREMYWDEEMSRKLFFFIIIFVCGCNNKKTGLNNPIVLSSIDSICSMSAPIRDSPCESIHIDEYNLSRRRIEWEMADSIAKYCSPSELEKLSVKHKSSAVRYVAFRLLLKKNPHKAVEILIDDIDSDDSIIATRLDEGFPELISSLRTDLIQGGRSKYNISIEDSIAVDNAILKSKNKLRFHYYPYLIERMKKASE